MRTIEVEYKFLDTDNPEKSLGYKMRMNVPSGKVKEDYTEAVKVGADKFWDSVVLMGALE